MQSKDLHMSKMSVAKVEQCATSYCLPVPAVLPSHFKWVCNWIHFKPSFRYKYAFSVLHRFVDGGFVVHVENASIWAYDLFVVVIYSLWSVWDGWGNDHDEIAMEKVLFYLF